MATTLNQYDFANIFNVYTDDNGYEFYNIFNTINIDGDIDPSLYTTHIWSGTDNFYTLSNQYYGTVRLWWAILVANNIMNPFEDIPAGKPIKILNQSVISVILSQINTI
jgi:hypothetical protein